MKSIFISNLLLISILIFSSCISIDDDLGFIGEDAEISAIEVEIPYDYYYGGDNSYSKADRLRLDIVLKTDNQIVNDYGVTPIFKETIATLRVVSQSKIEGAGVEIGDDITSQFLCKKRYDSLYSTVDEYINYRNGEDIRDSETIRLYLKNEIPEAFGRVSFISEDGVYSFLVTLVLESGNSYSDTISVDIKI